ncbi:ninjurin-1 [Chiloscyllium plagiosum]|uniref:ninjurin-1 n=1 Tax=Chiloscyllium plagiosum TaxID=36176 RepID=UPI001CB86CFD|nr:ninjurin-1 [Chiloscyllium plagiosum]
MSPLGGVSDGVGFHCFLAQLQRGRPHPCVSAREVTEPALGPEPFPALGITVLRLWREKRNRVKAMESESIELNGDPRNGGRAGDVGENPARRRRQSINFNHYANKKSAAESMLDIALLMANASQLKAVIDQGPNFNYYVPLIILISLSLIFQLIVGILLIFIVKYDLNDPNKQAKLDVLNNITTGLVFIIVIVNIFITAFGVQRPPSYETAPQHL